MKVAKNAYIVFCDDVREEKGNKLSLMGVYGEQLVLGEIPAILKSFHIVVFLEGIKKKFKKVRFVVDFPEGKPIDVSGDAPSLDPNKKGANIVFGISALKIKGLGVAKVKIFIDNAERPEVEKELPITMTTKSSNNQQKNL